MIFTDFQQICRPISPLSDSPELLNYRSETLRISLYWLLFSSRDIKRQSNVVENCTKYTYSCYPKFFYLSLWFWYIWSIWQLTKSAPRLFSKEMIILTSQMIVYIIIFTETSLKLTNYSYLAFIDNFNRFDGFPTF